MAPIRRKRGLYRDWMSIPGLLIYLIHWLSPSAWLSQLTGTIERKIPPSQHTRFSAGCIVQTCIGVARNFKWGDVQMDLPSSTHYANGWCWLSQKLLMLAASKFNTGHSPRESLHFRRKWCHHLLPVGRKSYKRVHFWSCSGRDFSMMVQPILKMFTVFETVIQGFHSFALL